MLSLIYASLLTRSTNVTIIKKQGQRSYCPASQKDYSLKLSDKPSKSNTSLAMLDAPPNNVASYTE